MITRGIFKANDIRGIIDAPGAQWDVEGARCVGAAFASVFGLGGREFVMGRDMRVSGPAVAAAFVEGARGQGASVVDIGLASTDEVWYASGALGLHGVQFTASHNPREYNGVKFCLPSAAPVTADDLLRLRDLAMGEPLAPAAAPGGYRSIDVLDAYAAHLHSLVDVDGWRPLRVIVDAGNGMAGHTTPAVLGPLGLDLIGLYLDLDGRFPNHPPNPLIPENLVDAQAAVREHGADLGLVFDGDADRCFIIDEHGDVVDPSIVTALIATQELRRDPGGAIVINTITSRAVGEAVAEAGGRLVISRVGHTSVKAKMAEHDAIFGGEHSAHYYFRDFWGADAGMLAALHVLAMLGHGDTPVSALAARFSGYVGSGEINSTVPDVRPVMERVEREFAGRSEVEVEVGDGVMASGPGWWVSVRPSNTEPLLRLNVEAHDAHTMATLRDETLAMIRGGTDE